MHVVRNVDVRPALPVRAEDLLALCSAVHVDVGGEAPREGGDLQVPSPLCRVLHLLEVCSKRVHRPRLVLGDDKGGKIVGVRP
eukprot:CAMPEP_0172043646 /NCGR_PEP_ID=MMETSP1041-20130122/26373_1 /TAXON_ID=464988 /ORGANISM="Hemiselmis andersenii, Strain CCMP439" /LENGTH=82 /DNA_ID=CAMNT_0012702085 /DNA_START=52 /DNA_END=296 /DNA_ORIENTATION=+